MQVHSALQLGCSVSKEESHCARSTPGVTAVASGAKLGAGKGAGDQGTKIRESQNDLGWKGHLGSSSSNPPALVRVARAYSRDKPSTALLGNIWVR